VSAVGAIARRTGSGGLVHEYERLAARDRPIVDTPHAQMLGWWLRRKVRQFWLGGRDGPRPRYRWIERRPTTMPSCTGIRQPIRRYGRIAPAHALLRGAGQRCLLGA